MKGHRASVKCTKFTQTPRILRQTRRSWMKNYIHYSLQKQCDFTQILLGQTHTHTVGINVIVLRAGRGRHARRECLCSSHVLHFSCNFTTETEQPDTFIVNTRQPVNWMGAVHVKNNENENSVWQKWITSSRTSKCSGNGKGFCWY
jgi:hypothetical protein